MGVSFAPASTKNLQRPGVVYRRLLDPSPTLEMAVVHRREDPSPVLRAFLAIVAEAGPRTIEA
jgi:DNA-binding transcriptional LysR family regulator